ncbi:hypothetical protein DMC30DRAFT_418612 [Rhodotorula diobovata]|uniref:Uncharacterized protein n=1 Tax=Rhodotorula diobovata TaxID=5288 RepID=A0A5C5FR09_9BASI|nr:hypothetical protein DMC30DRAFT_418612 [Rhodotorula diobovata]
MAAAHSDWELRFHDEVWPSGTSWDAFVATVRMVVLNTNRVSNVAAHKRWRGELQDWQDEVTAAALESRYYKLPWEEQEEDIEAVKRFDSQLKAMGRRGQLPFDQPHLSDSPLTADKSGSATVPLESMQGLNTAPPGEARIRMGSYKGLAVNAEGWPAGITWPDYVRTAEILANDALDSDNIRDNKANSDLLEKWIRGLVRPGYIGFFLRLSDEGRRAAIDGIECHHDILTHWTADYTVERQLPRGRTILESAANAWGFRPQERRERREDGQAQPVAHAGSEQDLPALLDSSELWPEDHLAHHHDDHHDPSMHAFLGYEPAVAHNPFAPMDWDDSLVSPEFSLDSLLMEEMRNFHARVDRSGSATPRREGSATPTRSLGLRAAVIYRTTPKRWVCGSPW